MRQIPPEIWLEVVEELPREDLGSFGLVDRAFSRVARPSLFRYFRFTPFDVVDGEATLPAEAVVQKRRNRLQFWLSPAVAPLVRECYLHPLERWQASDSDVAVRSVGDPLMLVYDFARDFHRLTNLHILNVAQSCAIQLLVDQIAVATTLRDFRISDTYKLVTPLPSAVIHPSPNLRIQKATFESDLTREDGIRAWAAVLDPVHLQSIKLRCGFRAWSENPSSVPVFPGVKRLDIRLPWIRFQNLRDILPKFPGVERFTIRGTVENDESAQLKILSDLAAGCRPFIAALRRLETSEEFLQTLLPLATNLTYLDIDPISDCSGEEILDYLPNDKMPSVTYLQLRLERLDATELQRILERFPGTQELRLDVFHSYPYLTTPAIPISVPTRLFKRLPAMSTVVPQLHSLAISYVFLCDEEEGLWKSRAQKNAEKMRDAILASWPALTSLWLGGHDYLITWRRDCGGYVEEMILAEEDSQAEVLNWGDYELDGWWVGRQRTW
ncbi:hypothetical protein MKEN_00198400 [Mycena kentingensis (nom. inval.)]|nr:hypothetical protein MKEN_00198400 [Mycena kentingensis (nom. inval.)]